MGKAPWLARPAVDGDPDVDDVVDIPEQVVEVAVCQIERHVADEECLRRRVQLFLWGKIRLCELDDNTAALKDLHVHSFNGAFGGRDTVESDISEARNVEQSVFHHYKKTLCSRTSLPLAQATVVVDNPSVLHGSVLLHLPLQVLGSDIVENISDVNRLFGFRR